MGLEEVLPKQESSTNLRGPVPYEATTSSFLLGPPCGASIQAEELCSLFSKPMDENVSSLGGKDAGASQKPESGHSPGDSQVFRGHRRARTCWDCPMEHQSRSFPPLWLPQPSLDRQERL